MNTQSLLAAGAACLLLAGAAPGLLAQSWSRTYGLSDTNVTFSVEGDADFDTGLLTMSAGGYTLIRGVWGAASAEADYEAEVEFFGDEQRAGKLEADVYAYGEASITGTLLSVWGYDNVRVRQRSSTVYSDTNYYSAIGAASSRAIDLPPLEVFSVDVEKTFDIASVFGLSLVRLRIGGNADAVLDADVEASLSMSSRPSVSVDVEGDVEASGEAWVEAVLVGIVGARVTVEPDFAGIDADLHAQASSSGTSGRLDYTIGRIDLDLEVELILFFWSPTIKTLQAYSRSSSSGSVTF